MTFLHTKGRHSPYISNDSGLATTTAKEATTNPIFPSKRWKNDFICDFTDSEEVYKHILDIVCYLSKYVAVRPVKSKTSE